MECPSCLLKYNASKRSPLIVDCGHSVCSQCFPSVDRCPGCSLKISKKSKINYSLMQVALKDQTNVDKFIKICFIGSSAVGKTCLIRMLTNQKYSEEIPSTIGYDFTFQDKHISNYNVRYQFWDSAGQQRYQSISPIHYKNAHIIVIVYDVTVNPSENRIRYWLNQVEKYCPEETTVLLVGNKIDLLRNQLSHPLEEQIVQEIRKGKVKNIEVSCREETGKQELWENFALYFQKRNTFRGKKLQQIAKTQKKPLKQEEKKKQTCC